MRVMKDTVQNALYSDSYNKDNIIELKSDLFKLLNGTNCIAFNFIRYCKFHEG